MAIRVGTETRGPGIATRRRRAVSTAAAPGAQAAGAGPSVRPRSPCPGLRGALQLLQAHEERGNRVFLPRQRERRIPKVQAQPNTITPCGCSHLACKHHFTFKCV